MSINKFNSEGYHDPTPHEALINVTREEKAAAKAAFKPLVYICSPFSGDIENNNKRTREFCRFALEKGNIPLAPTLCFLSSWMTAMRKSAISLFSWTLS